MKKKGFTLVELLAVIAILAIILLIAVPMILDVIETARRDSFRNSTLSIFGAIELEYSRNGIKNGVVKDLNVSNNQFKTGNWNYDESTGNITITQVCDGTYKVNSVTNKSKKDFVIDKDDGTCGFQIVINGSNPDNVNCHATNTYIDQGAKYGDISLTTTDQVNLKNAGSYELQYNYNGASATRVVNVSNTNTPTLTISETKVIISSTNTTFDPMDYVIEATDLCEGDIKSNVVTRSNVVLGVQGIYEVTYELVNKGNQKVSKTLEVEVKENELVVNGSNPDTVNCHATNKYIDQGATYNFDKNITVYADPLSLKNAGEYRLQYSYDLEGTSLTTSRTVNITNTNTPTITLTSTTITLDYGASFNPNNYLTSASDPCEGDITSKVTTTSNVVTNVSGTYQVIYKVNNLGNKEVTKTLNVTVKPAPIYLTTKFTSADYKLKNVGTSNEAYFFTGANPNNWVMFDGILWRIVKKDNEGIKMIYETECADPLTCTDRADGSIGGSDWINTSNTSNKWEDALTIDDRNSLRARLIDWYDTTITTTSLLSPINWCIGGVPDNEPTTLATALAHECSTTSNANGNFAGKTSSKTSYGLLRISDYMSASGATCNLTVTLDELPASQECGKLSDNTITNYLYKDYDWWTMNANSNNATNSWYVNMSGVIDNYYYGYMGGMAAVRPVLNLKLTTEYLSGTGTRTDPYMIK